MGKYTVYREFTAHGPAVQALGLIYKRLEGGSLQSEEVMPLIVFTAFSIEAYVNHLGYALPGWKERNPWKQKIERLHDATGRSCDWGMAPLDFAVEVFSIRDKLAHGKPERMEVTFTASAEEAEEYLNHPDLTPGWFRTCLNLDWAKSSRERFLRLAAHLGGMFGHVQAHISHASGTKFDASKSDPDFPNLQLLEINPGYVLHLPPD
ncbi:hypothetical protein [Stenotrophomonas sp.]|uniref:hypothetical protein n=1 Tax=Stenotrophomonas sp. TaxID=69392 RepID=UPI0028AFED8C|nr:hypothetical protein [Stenotrophomonas sp.]